MDMQPLTISCAALYHEQEQPESINRDKAPATKLLPSMHLDSTHYRNGGTEGRSSFQPLQKEGSVVNTVSRGRPVLEASTRRHRDGDVRKDVFH
jgi:hypothetical protein